MKYIRKICILILIVLGLALSYRYFVLGSYIDSHEVIGHTEDEVRSRFGEPDWIVDSEEDDGHVSWVYYHGLRGSSLQFENGVVTDVTHSTR